MSEEITIEQVANQKKPETAKKSKKGNKEPKKSFFKGVKAEFKKIIWPDGETLKKQSAVVVVSMVLLGILISVLDLIIKFGLNIVIG